MQALPPEQGSQAPHMMLRHSLGGGGQARWSNTGKPLRAAPKLKPPALPGDIYFRRNDMKLESGMDDLTDEQQYRAHLRALREGLLHTTIVIERAARAYVQTRAILDQI